MSYLLNIELDDLDIHERCGSGTYGSVNRASWRTKNKEVAVKKVHHLDKEADILSRISHRNIVQFYGIVSSHPNFYIVMEYARHGSLYDFIRLTEESNSFKKILQWSKEIALGMNYLHYEAPVKVIHRDLKSKNVVISESFTCKICDFGSSRYIDNTSKMSVVGTYPWMAPEIIQSKPASEACDTWSFGVVLWEIITREIPFHGIPTYQLMWLIVQQDKRLAIPDSCPQQFSSLMSSCWQKEPKSRPTFKSILLALDNMLQDELLEGTTELFLQKKSVWSKEIEDAFRKLEALEHKLTAKEIELLQKERQLNEKEKLLGQHLNTKQPDLHDVATWRETDVSQWISTLSSMNDDNHSGGLHQYANLFISHHINGKRLLELQLQDLKELGITAVGHRREIMNELDRLRSSCNHHYNFPPLRKQESDDLYLENNVVKEVIYQHIKITFTLGAHIKARAHEDMKWMPYLLCECDDDDFDQKLHIQEVVFYSNVQAYPPIGIKVPPYSGNWNLGISPAMILQCVILFNKSIVITEKIMLELKLHPLKPLLEEEKTVEIVLQKVSELTPTGSTAASRKDSLVLLPRNDSSPSLVSSPSIAQQPETLSYAKVTACTSPKYSLVPGKKEKGVTSLQQVKTTLDRRLLQQSNGTRSRHSSASSNRSTHSSVGSSNTLRVAKHAPPMSRSKSDTTPIPNRVADDSRRADSGIGLSTGSSADDWTVVTNKKPKAGGDTLSIKRNNYKLSHSYEGRR